MLVRIDRHCGRSGAAFLAALLGIAPGVEGTGVALEWSEAPVSPAPWAERHGHAAVILDDEAVLSLGGRDKNDVKVNDVFKIVPGGTTLQQVTASAEWSARSGICVVHLPGTNEIVLINGGGQNDAWRSTDSGLNFTKISSKVFALLGRTYHGCVAVTATKLFAFGGGGWAASTGAVRHNDVRVSTDSGATWTDVDHSSCGVNQQRWTKRQYFGYTFMPLLGRIVIAGGRDDTLWHNDVWYSNSDAKCWTLAKNDTNLAADGYYGAVLLAVPFGGVEALLLLGGYRKGGGYISTAALSIDGGSIWSIMASVGTTWTGRRSFAAIVDTRFARVLIWGGDYPSTDILWTVPLHPVYTALAPYRPPFSFVDAYCGSRTPCLIEGNDQLTIIGTNFSDAADLSVAVDGKPCTDVTVTAAYTAICTTPCFASFSTHFLVSITSSSAPNGIIFNTSLSSSGNGAVSVATADVYTSIATDFVCSSSPNVTGIECIAPGHCNVDASGSLRVPANELIVSSHTCQASYPFNECSSLSHTFSPLCPASLHSTPLRSASSA